MDTSQALDRFLAGVERRAYRMAWIATGHRDEALDLVQDAMLRLVQAYADRDAREWGPLFQRTLQNAIRDWHRRNRVRRRWRAWLGVERDAEEAPGDPLETRFASAAPGPCAQAAADEAVAALDRALRTLPLRQQQAFLLRHWEGLDVAGTAAVMGCSEGSVKTHFSRAVRKLRDMLEEHGP